MTFQKRTSEILEITLWLFAGNVGFLGLHCRERQDKDRHPEGESKPVHTRISFRGPVPESNLAAIASDILKRSHCTPEARSIDV